MVESILAIRLHYNDDKRIRELVNGVKIYIGEEKGTAIARVPLFEYVPLERKHGRWFFSPDIKGAPAMQAAGVAELFKDATQETIDRMEEATRLVRRSKSLDELEKLLKKMVGKG